MTKTLFGVELHEYLDAVTVLHEAQSAARLGYDAIWYGDSQMIWREMYTLMGATAATTSKVMLGTGVTNPLTRHPAVTASALLTLQELSGGRVMAGVGVGDSSLMTMGMSRLTRAQLREFIATLRTLAAGEPVATPGGEMRVTFGGPGKCPPILIAGAGPKMLHLAGEVADGAVVTGIAAPGATADGMLGAVRDGRAQADRLAEPFTTTMAVAVAVDDDPKRAYAAVRPHVARSLLGHMWPMDALTKRVSEQVREEYDFYEHMSPSARHREIIPDEVVDQFAIAGTADDCLKRCRELFDCGFDEITVRPYALGDLSRADMMQRFAVEVMEPFRRLYG